MPVSGVVDSAETPEDRLASAVITRRGALGLRQIDLPRRGHISLDRIQTIEAGKVNLSSLRTTTKRELERALDWEPGSVDEIRAGRTPKPRRMSPLQDPQRVVDAIGDLPPDVQDYILGRVKDLPKVNERFGHKAMLAEMTHLVELARAARENERAHTDDHGEAV